MSKQCACDSDAKEDSDSKLSRAFGTAAFFLWDESTEAYLSGATGRRRLLRNEMLVRFVATCCFDTFSGCVLCSSQSLAASRWKGLLANDIVAGASWDSCQNKSMRMLRLVFRTQLSVRAQSVSECWQGTSTPASRPFF